MMCSTAMATWPTDKHLLLIDTNGLRAEGGAFLRRGAVAVGVVLAPEVEACFAAGSLEAEDDATKTG